MTKKIFSRGMEFALTALALSGCALRANAQQVTVTSPASGTVYSPGSTITVTANVSGPILGVRAAAQDIGESSYEFAAPYSMSFTVPPGIIGPKNLFVYGLVASNTAVFSPIVTVDIEPTSAPTAITFQQPLVAFGYVGQQQRIGVTATFADGSTLDVTGSTRISFTSGSSALVSVGLTGLMTALAPETRQSLRASAN